jgi:hypothetical protein
MATTIMDDEQQAFYVILDTLCNGFLRVRSSQSTFWLFFPGLRVYKFKEQPRNCNRKKRCRCRAEDEEGFLYFWYILRGFTNHSHRTSTSLTMNRSTPWISLLCLSGVLSRNGIVLQASPPPPLLLLSTGVSISNSSSSQEGLSALRTSLFTSGQTFSCYPRVAEVACPSAFASHPYIGVWISYRQGGLSQCWARYAEVKHRVFRAPRSPVRISLSLEATTCLRCLPISRDLL